MQTSTTNDAGLQVADYGRMLRRQAWLILLVMLGCGLLAAGYTALQSKSYQATSGVLVKPIIINPADASKRTSDLINMDTESQLVRSAPVVGLAKAALKSNMTQDQLTEAVSVTVPANTEVLQITYTGSSAKAAQQGAQAFTDAYLKYRSAQASGDAKRQLAAAQKQALYITSQLLDVSGKIAGAATNSTDKAFYTSSQQALTSQLTDTRTTISRLTNIVIDPGTVVQSPELPKNASSPSLPLNVAIGLALGALLGLLVAMIRHRRDDRVRSASDLEETLDLPVLATVPTPRTSGGQLATLGGSAGALEAYRRLRSVLLGALHEDGRRRPEATLAEALPSAREGERTRPPGRIILVTAAGESADTAEVGANLAVLFAKGGASVVLIDTRTDSPAVAIFGLRNDRGLSDVVEHEAYGEELVQRPADIPNLAVIGSGRGANSVGEVMSTRVGRSLLEWLQRSADYVIVTAASVTASADAQTLAPMAHAVLLTVSAGVAREHEVRSASHDLAQVGAPVAGAVLLARARRTGASSAGRSSEVTSSREEAAALSASTQS